MYNFTVSEVLDQAWALTKKHGLLLALILLVISLVEGAFTSTNPADYTEFVSKYQSGAADPQAFMQDYSALLSQTAFSGGTALGMLLSLVLTCALTAIMLSLAKGKTSEISIEPCKMPVMTYVKYIAWQLLYGIIVGFGLCLCIIPGVWLGARLCTVSYYLIDNPEIGFGEAISRGWNSTSGHVMGLIGLGILCFFIVIAGLLLCCVGIYFTEVIAHFAIIIVYLVLSGFYNRPADESSDVVETVEVEEIK